MPRVTVRLHGAFRGFAGGARSAVVEADDVAGALAGLVRAHPALEHLAATVADTDALLCADLPAPDAQPDVDDRRRSRGRKCSGKQHLILPCPIP